MNQPPFFVMGTPRSRTAWLARFLSHGDRQCLHEPSRYLRGHADLVELVNRPGAGASDSLLTFRWREVARARPDARFVVVRRPIDEVCESLGRIGLWHPRLLRILENLNAVIDEMIEDACVLSLPFHALARRDACAAVFEHCLGVPMPDGHWEAWKDRNIQADPLAALNDASANADAWSLFPELVEAI